jgi:hypothetical protein
MKTTWNEFTKILGRPEILPVLYREGRIPYIVESYTNKEHIPFLGGSIELHCRNKKVTKTLVIYKEENSEIEITDKGNLKILTNPKYSGTIQFLELVPYTPAHANTICTITKS